MISCGREKEVANVQLQDLDGPLPKIETSRQIETQYNCCSHGDYLQEASDMVLDVAYQLKEKLVVRASHPLNGCLLNGENGMSKLETELAGVHYNVVTSREDACSKTEEPTNSKVSEISAATTTEDTCSASPTHGFLPGSLVTSENPSIAYVSYESELQMPDIMRLIQKDLSEPYSIYTYRYFIHNWPKLCFLAMVKTKCVGAVVCKLDLHKKIVRRGYIAMLAVDENYRKQKIGSNLVLKAIRAMVADDADEVVLETEITNKPALRLYENLGFVRDKRLFRYYLNGVDALRLKLWLR